MANKKSADLKVNPITYEVLRNAFAAVCNEMALVVAKTAYSTPVNEGRDFAGVVYDRHGKLVSQGEFDLPAFVGLTQLTVPEVIRAIGLETMKPEDIYMINDPYVASTHCNDIHQVKPIFYQGQLVAFVSSTAHWSDVGGVAPGSLNSTARTHFEEGVRIPAIRIYNQGVLNQDILNLLLHNMRQSWERIGDLNAQVAACKAGEARIQALIEQHGVETVLACMEEVQNHSERLARASWASLPDGVYEAEDFVDQDVHTGEPKRIHLKLIVEGDHAIFDLTGSDDAAQASINCTMPATTSALFLGLATILPPMPMNSGIMRTIEIKARRGSIVWAQPPSAISGLAATTMECVIGCVGQALSMALPERGAATPYSILNTVFAGFDERPEFQSPFINYVWAFGGVGATKYKDGANVVGSPYTASTQNIPCELQERRYPGMWAYHQILPDSGGAGRTRGGMSLLQQVRFPYGGGTISCIGDRERFGPPGIFGGDPGRKAGLVINRGTETERNIGIFSVNQPVVRGEWIDFWSAGAGGYGDSLDRSTEWVLEDVKDEYVTLQGAREQYGVMIKEIDRRRLQFEVDQAATDQVRAQMRATRAPR